jgi:hypothetical protein
MAVESDALSTANSVAASSWAVTTQGAVNITSPAIERRANKFFMTKIDVD